MFSLQLQLGDRFPPLNNNDAFLRAYSTYFNLLCT